VEQFFRIVDRKREQAARQDKSRRWRERVRVVPGAGEQQDSAFHVLPEGMPIDYFDPTFFNQLQPRTRNRVAISKISLLPIVGNSLTWNADERMSDRAFTDKYGAEVFVKYEMVDDADIGDDGDDEWTAEDEKDEDMTERDDFDDDFDISASRSTLSNQLSTNSVA